MRNGRLAPALLLTVLLIGCKGSFSARTTAQQHGTFRYPLEKNVVTFDPGKVQDPEAIELLGNVYEGLVAYDESNQIVPQLAESYQPSSNGKVWTFHLRPNAKFHDGKAVTASDFKWTFERNLNAAFASPVAANYLGDIEGAEAFAQGKGSLSGIKVIDSSTLQITLVEPRPYFLGKLTYPCAAVLERGSAGPDEIRDIEQMVGTGPFAFSAIDPDQQVSLTANLTYYLGPPKLERIERPIIKDPVTRLNKYNKGEIDMTGVLRADLDAIEGDPEQGVILHLDPRPVVYYLGINPHAYTPFKDLRVRRAFAMGIDRTKLDDILKGMPEAHGLLPDGIQGSRSGYKGIGYDPKEASRLLSEAGYPNGRGLPILEIAYRESAPDSRVLVESVHASLTKNIHFPVRLKALEAGVFFERRNAGKLPSYFLSWGADYLDPQNFTTFLFRSDSPMNFDGYHNDDFDRIAKKADSEIEQGKRIPLYQQAEDILIQDVARVPLYFGRDARLVKPRVRGLRSNLMGNLPHLKVSLDP